MAFLSKFKPHGKPWRGSHYRGDFEFGLEGRRRHGTYSSPRERPHLFVEEHMVDDDYDDFASEAGLSDLHLLVYVFEYVRIGQGFEASLRYTSARRAFVS